MYIGRSVNKRILPLYVPRMVRETGKIGVWTCLLQHIRLEHFEIIRYVSISTQYRSSHVAHAKIYVLIRKLNLTMDGQNFAFLTYFEKLARRSQSFAKINFYRNL